MKSLTGQSIFSRSYKNQELTEQDRVEDGVSDPIYDEDFQEEDARQMTPEQIEEEAKRVMSGDYAEEISS